MHITNYLAAVGGGLQVFGVFITALPLVTVRRRFGQLEPTRLGERLASWGRWLRAKLSFQHKTTASAGAAMVGVVAFNAKGTVEPGPLDSSLKLADQVVELDQHMREALQIARSEARNIGNRLEERIDAGSRDAEDRDTKLQKDLELVATGGVRVTWWSIFMILVGTALLTLAGAYPWH